MQFERKAATKAQLQAMQETLSATFWDTANIKPSDIKRTDNAHDKNVSKIRTRTRHY